LLGPAKATTDNEATCYENNPSFLKFIQETGLPFKAMDSFRTAEMEERSELYLRRQPIKAASKERANTRTFSDSPLLACIR
jgi:hypothetical protein